MHAAAWGSLLVQENDVLSSWKHTSVGNRERTAQNKLRMRNGYFKNPTLVWNLIMTPGSQRVHNGYVSRYSHDS